jgi:hypothetical protein
MARPFGFQGLVNACGRAVGDWDEEEWLWRGDLTPAGGEDEEVEEKKRKRLLSSKFLREASSRSRCGGKIRWGWRLDLCAGLGIPLSGSPPCRKSFLGFSLP